MGEGQGRGQETEEGMMALFVLKYALSYYLCSNNNQSQAARAFTSSRCLLSL